MTAAEARALVEAAIAQAVAVADASDAGEYATRQAVEAAIAAARTALQAAIDAVVATSTTPVSAWPLVARLRALAASLLDLDRALGEALQTRELVLTSDRGIVDIALELYADAGDADVLAWVERLHVLNPHLSDPNRIAAGETVVVYVVV